MYDLIVIGAGPAGLAAAAYAARRRLSTLLIAPDLSGKARFRLRVPWVQERERIAGEEAVEQMRQQVLALPDATRYLDVVEQVFLHDQAVHVITGEGGAFAARALIIATGVTPRALGVPGEQRLMGYGVSYSASSHAPLFAGRRVVIVGSDLRAVHAVNDLRAIAAHVTLVMPDPAMLSSHALGEQIMRDEQVTVLAPAFATEITGEAAVNGLIVIAPDGSVQHLPTDGVFIEIGLVAQTDFVGALVERTANGQIIVNDRCATSSPAVFAAGDVTNAPYAEQVLIALGEGMKAAISACAYLYESAFPQQREAVG